jgi:acyl-CoA thioesterase
VSADQQNEREALEELMASLGPESRTFAAEAILGDEARQFATSDIGRYMIGCAQQDLEEAHQKLSTTHPWRWRRIQQLQNDIRCSTQFLTYIRDLVIRGTVAGKALEEHDQ